MISNYDGELDIYLKCLQVWFILRKLNGTILGKNDMIDILHLIYLSENDVMISEDKIFQKLVSKLPLFEVYGVDEFLQQRMKD